VTDEKITEFEFLLHQHLLVNYPQDDYVRSLMETTNIHIMPSMNPDGFEVSREGDCGGVQGRYVKRAF
jgi:murein tripeptide amidase MpaA